MVTRWDLAPVFRVRVLVGQQTLNKKVTSTYYAVLKYNVQRLDMLMVQNLELQLDLFNTQDLYRKNNQKRALELARRLKVELNQERVSIVFPNETIMLENDDNDTNFLLNETKV